MQEDIPMPHLNHLFAPIEIGSMTVKNRLLMPSMSINFGVDDNCYVTDQLTEYFVERARGGVGMMMVGGGGVHPGGQEQPDLPLIYEDGCIPALKQMVEKVKGYGTRFGVQLMHGGRQCYLPQKVAPSAIPAPAVVKGEVRALEIPEIKKLVGCFGDATRRCKDAGFDFVEIHAAHGYLINQFMSPNANVRTDEYGGSFENRTRFFFEVMADIREKTGPDFPVGIRINGNDYMENGWTLDDTVRLVPFIEKAGAAYIHVSAGVYGSTELTIPSMYSPHGCFAHLARAVKAVASVPVITVGRIKDPRFADEILANGDADMVAMGRALLADPHMPAKALAGNFSAIRPCVGCCLGCIHAVLAGEPGSCVVNPDVGREAQVREEQSSLNPQKILVVGAGPSGMAAARLFTLRGHQVRVVEKGPDTGGLMALAARAPGRGEINDILNFFRNELTRLGIEIQHDTVLNEDVLNQFQPDRVILATGSMPDMPVIKGLFQTGMSLVTNVDILSGEEAPGKKVIVLGGGMTGLITADFLGQQGCEVHALNRKNRFAEEMSANDRYYLRESIKEKNITLYKKVAVKGFTRDGVTFKTRGETVSLEGCDMVVISEKQVSVREIKALEDKTTATFHVIGDAKLPRHLMFCISEAEEIARSI
jgi:2,4-dienoyl-CoA reductase-like NADH-dependent reductase (Old Yellow Enzyme family)/thioredoxin reductase